MTDDEIKFEAATRHVRNMQRMLAILEFEKYRVEQDIAMLYADNKPPTKRQMNERRIAGQVYDYATQTLASAREEAEYWQRKIKKEMQA